MDIEMQHWQEVIIAFGLKAATIPEGHQVMRTLAVKGMPRAA
jgi:hypothetical protein